MFAECDECGTLTELGPYGTRWVCSECCDMLAREEVEAA